MIIGLVTWNIQQTGKHYPTCKTCISPLCDSGLTAPKSPSDTWVKRCTWQPLADPRGTSCCWTTQWWLNTDLRCYAELILLSFSLAGAWDGSSDAWTALSWLINAVSAQLFDWSVDKKHKLRFEPAIVHPVWRKFSLMPECYSLCWKSLITTLLHTHSV